MPVKSTEDFKIVYPEIPSHRNTLDIIQCSRSAPNSRPGSFRKRNINKLQLQIEQPRRNSFSLTETIPSHATTEKSLKKPLQRVRSFKLTSKGIQNKGDSFRTKSENSLSSTGSGSASDEDLDCKSRQRIPSNTSDYSSDASLCNSWQQDYYKVLIIGAGGVGKTSLVNQFMTSEYMGFADGKDEDDGNGDDDEVVVSVLLDGEESMLEFIDSSEPWEDVVCQENVDAYLVVYAVDNKPSYNEATDILHYLSNIKGTDRPIILVANKIDLVRKNLVMEEDAKDKADEYHCKFCGVSVVINHNVDELLVGILRQIRRKLNPDSDSSSNAIYFKYCSESKTQNCAKGILNKLFKKSHKLMHSCENLFDM